MSNQFLVVDREVPYLHISQIELETRALLKSTSTNLVVRSRHRSRSTASPKSICN